MKETINVKSNGLRNELKEIRKSIDKLTNVIGHIIDIWAHTQTNKQNENNNYNCTCGNSRKLRESKHDDE